MSSEIPIHFNPTEAEKKIYDLWIEKKAFAAVPQEGVEKYVIMMPLPNVTGALHMGHAMDNCMQDLLVRWHRMIGHDTLWMAGTDHAGIATQAIVEKRLFELSGKTRHDIGREALVQRIFEWKDEYQTRIVSQLKSIGCSADWDRLRFTMDKVCSRAVRHTFFKMFADGIIYRGTRLVNWDCKLQTAVADDEIVYEVVNSHFWYIRYPFIDPKPGEPEYVVVATTRPETMLGDTAVACHPDPAAALDAQIETTKAKLSTAPKKEHEAIQKELERLEERKTTHLPQLLQYTEMAKDGRKILLPLLNREIPLVLDEWAKPEKGSGCVKTTPAHDPNDYLVWGRHEDEMEIVNILNIDGTLNENVGPYKDMDRFDARAKVVADLEAQGLMEAIEDHSMEVGHSDRSGSPIEPFLSLQWFVNMGDVPGGIVCGKGTSGEFTTPGLAQAAIDAVEGKWKTHTGRSVEFHPEPARYSGMYLSWLKEKRDWCISRQLWWGHRIPIWKREVPGEKAEKIVAELKGLHGEEDFFGRIGKTDGSSVSFAEVSDLPAGDLVEVMVCLRDEAAENTHEAKLNELGLERDPDVLDTWFSSMLWPQSTLGWPDPATAEIEEGQTTLGPVDGGPDCLTNYYPGSCLVTARDIISLWVARMILAGLYNLGDVPFTDVFIHANILDGKGERMSKSKGNGIDPVDIIEKYGTDAMRYVLAETQTGTQDIRLPVQAISPFTGNPIDLGKAKHGSTIFTYICPESGKEFDVLGTMKDVPAAKLISERFEVGAHFCTKLWNAARLAFMNLEGYEFTALTAADLTREDRWILSRLSRTIGSVNEALGNYNPALAIGTARSFFWNELCDWYLEMIKPRLQDADQASIARQVLASVLDQVLRLFHPFTPYITETLWQTLNQLAPKRGIDGELQSSELLIKASWPEATPALEDESLEKQIALMQEAVRAIRDVRAKYGISPKTPLKAVFKASGEAAAQLAELSDAIKNMAALESLDVRLDAVAQPDAAVAVVGDLEIHVQGVVDIEKEIVRLEKQRDTVGKFIEGSKRKLANEKFVERAKPEVVQKERDLLAENEAEVESLVARLEVLEKLGG
jgi:valyl-tRNA synthetase